MKKLLILTLLFISSLVCSSEYFHPYANNVRTNLNDLYPYQVIILQDIPYMPYPKDIVKDFHDKVVKFSFKYQKYAKRFNIERPLPFNIFVFRIGFENLSNADNYTGYCDLKRNTIYLEPYFTERTFFHELGHCDLGYSHKEDELVGKNGKSKYLMNWNFDPDYYNLDLNTVLSNFFIHTNHNQLFSDKGHASHNAMVRYKKEFKDKSE